MKICIGLRWIEVWFMPIEIAIDCNSAVQYDLRDLKFLKYPKRGAPNFACPSLIKCSNFKRKVVRENKRM